MTIRSWTGGVAALVLCALAPGCGRTPVPCGSDMVLYLYQESEHDDVQLRTACIGGDVRGRLAFPAGVRLLINPNPMARHRQLTEPHRPWNLPHVFAFRLPGQRYLLMYEGNDGGSGAEGRGFITVSPHGGAARVAFSAGSSKLGQSYFRHLHINLAGTLMAVANAYMRTDLSTMHIIRLAGPSSGTGPAVCASRPDTTTHSMADSVVFGGGHIHYSAGKVAGPHHTQRLYRTPLDCSSRTSEAAFPLGPGVEAHTANVLETSADGSKLAVVVFAAKDGDYGDIMVVDTASGGVANITNDLARYGGYGPYRGLTMHRSAGRLRISPTGKRLAYVGRHGLHIRDTGAKKPAVLVTRAPLFSSPLMAVTAIEWLSDDEVVFWQGPSIYNMELFHYSVSSGALTNTTRTGAGATPPFGKGMAVPMGGWWSPDRSLLYFLQQGLAGQDVRALDTRTLKVRDITRGVFANPDSVQASLHGNRVYFAASLGRYPGNPNRLYMFDQRAGTPAVMLFAAKSGRIENIVPSPNGMAVVFDAGGVTHAITTGGAVTVLAEKARVSSELFTRSAELVFATKKSGRAELRVQPLGGGPSRLLDQAGTLIAPLTVF